MVFDTVAENYKFDVPPTTPFNA